MDFFEWKREKAPSKFKTSIVEARCGTSIEALLNCHVINGDVGDGLLQQSSVPWAIVLSVSAH